jgi:hypothetical protein
MFQTITRRIIALLSGFCFVVNVSRGAALHSDRRINFHILSATLCSGLRDSMCSAYNRGVHVFIEAGDFAILERPNMRPKRSEISAGGLDPHGEVA